MVGLGELLRSLRGKRSLREASKLTGISHNYLSIVERGFDPRSGAPVHPTPDTLKKLAEAYDYPYNALMRRAGYIPEADEDGKIAADGTVVRQFIDLDMTNEEIKERLTFKIDGRELTDEFVDDFISYVRWQLAKKKKEQPDDHEK